MNQVLQMRGMKFELWIVSDSASWIEIWIGLNLRTKLHWILSRKVLPFTDLDYVWKYKVFDGKIRPSMAMKYSSTYPIEIVLRLGKNTRLWICLIRLKIIINTSPFGLYFSFRQHSNELIECGTWVLFI